MEFFRIHARHPVHAARAHVQRDLARDVPAGRDLPRVARPELRRRLPRRHGDRGDLRARRSTSTACAPRSTSCSLGEYSAQSFGRSDTALIRLPLKEGVSSAAAVRARDGRAQGGRPVSATQQRVEFVGPQVGKELYENGALALLLVSLGIVALPRAALRMALRGGGDHRQPARRHHHPGLLRVLPVGVLAAGAGGDARGARLLGERVGRHRRPDPRELPQDAQGHA